MGLFSWFKRKQVEVIPPLTYTCKECGATGPISYISYHFCEKEIEMEFTFTTREEYGVYREDWKARYAAQIIDIRKAKEVFKQANREFSAASKGADYFACDNAAREVHKTMEYKRGAFYSAKNAATKLLEERIASKVEAGRQRELRLKKVA